MEGDVTQWEQLRRTMGIFFKDNVYIVLLFCNTMGPGPLGVEVPLGPESPRGPRNNGSIVPRSIGTQVP